MMRRIILASILASCAFGAAHAADLVASEDQQEVVAVDQARFDWTGYYIGLFGGYASGDASAVGNPGFDGSAPDDRADLEPDGFAGGLVIGRNWQQGNLVFGLEAELGYLDASDSFFFPNGDDYFAEMDYGIYGAGSARLGFALDRFLIFGKAGLAVAHFEDGYGDVDGGPSGSPDPTASVFDSGTMHGRLLGGGIAYAIDSSWSAQIEYNHIEFEDRSAQDVDGDTYQIENSVQLVKFSIVKRF